MILALRLYGSLQLINFAMEVLVLLQRKSLDGFYKVEPFVNLLLNLVLVKRAYKDTILLGLVEELTKHEELVIEFCLVFVI